MLASFHAIIKNYAQSRGLQFLVWIFWRFKSIGFLNCVQIYDNKMNIMQLLLTKIISLGTLIL